MSLAYAYVNLVNNIEIFRILQLTVIGLLQNVSFASVGFLETFSLVFLLHAVSFVFLCPENVMIFHLIYFNLYNKVFYFLLFLGFLDMTSKILYFELCNI